jgi:assimilatory nitrate reductase catalytic subunit
MSQTSLQTTCAYCGVGCGVKLPRINDRSIKVKGDESHPANKGRLCVKGTHLGDVLPLKERLLFPQIEGERVSWETANTTIAEKIKSTIAEHGPDAFAFYLSGQLLTEDYYAANKLAKGFIGTANVDTNSRLCMSSAVAAHIRAFGEDAPPVNYEDLELADLVILTGSNLAWAHPVLFQRMQNARKTDPNKKLVVIDPRKSASAKEADLHLAIKPGSDGFLFNALLVHLHNREAINPSYIDDHVSGYLESVKVAIEQVGTDIEHQAKLCGITSESLVEFFELFEKTPKTTTVWSMGINQSESGVDKGNAIINVHLATGRIGLPGATAFSITGQPNAMGGREVGGLANQLAAHRFFDEESIATVQEFWQAETMATQPGLKTVDLFNACQAGEIKVLWIMGTNPVASLPDANKIKAALKQVDMVIVSDVVNNNDTLDYANIKLPALAWGEKDGTVTNSERTISRQRAYLLPPGQTRADWAAVAGVAKEMGFNNAFNWHHSHELFREHAQLSTINTETHLAFDLTDAADITFRQYQDWQPKQWPLVNGQSTERMFSNGQFSTPNGKANMVPVAPVSITEPSDQQFVLNTGRLRDQWHTMSRTGLANPLTKHTSQFEVHVNPNDAQKMGIHNGNLINVSSGLGSFYALARIEPSQTPGNVFAPMHWNVYFANKGGVAQVIDPVVDPISGQPASKHSLVNLNPVIAKFSGFLFIKTNQAVPAWLDETIAFKTLTNQGTLYQYFHLDLSTNEFKAQQTLPDAVTDHDSKIQRFMNAEGNELGLTYWLVQQPTPMEWPDIDFLDFAAKTNLDELDPKALLKGFSDDVQNLGSIVCSCYSVTDRQIEKYFLDHPNGTIESLQTELKCGTNCGSCLTEVKELTKLAKVDVEFLDVG